MRYNIQTHRSEKERMENGSRVQDWFLSSAESSSSTTKDFINYKYWL
jgi:hypothetical protein